MNILEDIKNMVDVAYEQVIEGEGIYSDFEHVDIFTTPFVIDLFINEIPAETVEKWKKKLRKKTLRDVLTNSPDDYMIGVGGNLTWKNADVNEWQMQFFCEKIVNLYKKNNEILSPLETFFKENPDSALERFREVKPMNNVEEYCFLLLRELIREEIVVSNWGELSPARQDEFLQNWIDKLNNIY